MPKSKIFVNKINKEIKNNIKSYRFVNDNNIVSNKEKPDIKLKINNFFNSDEFVYKLKVNIILNDGKTLIEDVIAVKDNELVTLSGTKIKIDDISDIKKAN